MPTDTLLCHQRRRRKGESLRRFRPLDLCEKQRRESRAQKGAPKKPESPSGGGRLLAEQLKFRLLERDVSELSTRIEMLTALLDKEELTAAMRVKKKSPSNATLKIWANRSTPPEHLTEEPEEHLW